MPVKSKTALSTDVDTKLASNVPIVASVHRSLEKDIILSYEDFIGSYTTAQIAALTGMTLRQIVFNTSINEYYFYNGVAWIAFSSGGSAKMASFQTQADKRVYTEAEIQVYAPLYNGAAAFASLGKLVTFMGVEHFQNGLASINSVGTLTFSDAVTVTAGVCVIQYSL